jgi:tight adherence protein B
VVPLMDARLERCLEPFRRRGRAVRRDAQLPEALDRVASAIRAGASIGPALAEVARTCPDPLGEELRPVGRALEHGAGLAQALDLWTTATSSRDAALVAAALGLGGEAGGGVARAVDGVAATLRERRELRAEARALATQARSSAALLVLAPPAFAALVSSIEPGVVGFLVSTPIGLACLALGLALDAVGAWWMARIVDQAAA